MKQYQPKRNLNVYLALEPFESDEDVTNKTEKIVKIRKEQTCPGMFNEDNQAHEIPKGELAYRETGIMEGTGWVTSYYCLKCYDNYLDSMEKDGVNIDEYASS